MNKIVLIYLLVFVTDSLLAQDKLGVGYRLDKQEFVSTAFEGSDYYCGIQSASMNFSVSRRATDMEQRLSAMGGVREIFAASGDFECSRERSRQVHRLDFVSSYQIHFKTRMLGNYRFTEEAKSFILNLPSLYRGRHFVAQNFIKKYGTHYVRGTKMGGELEISIKVESTDERIKDMVTERVIVEALFQSSKKENHHELFREHHDIFVSVSSHQIGGDPGLFERRFPKGVTCTLSSADDCAEYVQAVMRYAYGQEEEDFPAQLSANPGVLGHIFGRYQDVAYLAAI